MGEIRIGLLGSGYMGRTYAECMTKYNTRTQIGDNQRWAARAWLGCRIWR